jgi:putative copper export protein
MRDATHALDVGLVSSLVERTKWGTGWLAQLVGIVVAGVGYHRRWWTLAGVGAALTALSPALSGHAAAAERFGLLAILADWLHVLGAGSWLGTLAVLLFAGMSSPDGTRLGRGEWVRVLVQRFSPIALVSAAVATITGIFAAWIHVGTIPNLWGTRYGVTLLVKLGLLVGVMLAGAYNWRVVQRRLGPDDAAAQLRRSATVEVVLAVLVLLVTAVLVATPTPLGVGP